VLDHRDTAHRTDSGPFRGSGKLPKQNNRQGWPTTPRDGIEQLHREVRSRGLRTKGNRHERKAARRRRNDLLHEEVPSPGVSRAGAAAILAGSADLVYERPVSGSWKSVPRKGQASPNAFASKKRQGVRHNSAGHLVSLLHAPTRSLSTQPKHRNPRPGSTARCGHRPSAGSFPGGRQ
jgi:hypothetical protein